MRYLVFALLLSLTVLLAGCGEDAPPPVAAAPAPAAGPSRPRELARELAREREVEAFPTTGEPSLTRNFYFVFDDSGSMNRQVGSTGTRIEIARRATTEFLKQVPPDVQMGLYALNKGELVALGKDNRDGFVAAVQRLTAAGGTPLNTAIDKAVDVLVAQRKRQLGYGDFRVIVVTDGESGDGDIGANAGPYALQARIPLYTIGLCVGGDHALKRFSVSYRAADSEQDLQKGLEEVAGESESFDAAAFRK